MQGYRRFLTPILILLVVFIIFNHYHAKQTQSNISTILKIDYHHSPNETTHQWRTRQTESKETKLKLAATTVVAGVLCFLAASICSACGIGGGGLFIPILTLVAGVDLKTASSLSAFMVTGGSLANVMCNLFTKSSKFGGKSLIDFDIALLSEPCMLLGVSVGVICNRVFPEWVITILFAVFLAWSTFKTCKSGVVHWRLESEEAEERGLENLKNGLEKEAGSTCDDGNEGVNGTKEPTLGVETEHCKSGFSWITVGVFLLVWFSFFLLHLLRDNRYLQNIILVKPCGVAYWILTSTQIPLAVIFTAWILYRKQNVHQKTPNHQDEENLAKGEQINKIIFPIMALSAGILGGIFGIGGGMLINPLLLEVGIAPEITAATCCLMVFFSSSMSAIQYYLLGMKHLDTAIIFATICFVQSILGLMVVKKAVRKYGRASLIVFSLGIVMALSTVLMTSFGALKVWKDYTTTKYMGFKPPC